VFDFSMDDSISLDIEKVEQAIAINWKEIINYIFSQYLAHNDRIRPGTAKVCFVPEIKLKLKTILFGIL
jgi:hypothetical protein